MQTKRIAFLNVFLVLITVSCLGTSAPMTTTATPAPDQVSNVVFKAPEDAITSYLEGVVQSDIHKISRACAINEMSEKFKFDLYTGEWLGGAFMPFQSLSPTDYPFYVETNKMQLSPQIFTRVKILAYSLLSSEKEDGSTITGMDAKRINSFMKDVDPKRLSSLKVKEIGLPNKTLMNSAIYQETAAKFARVYGADEKTERVALFSFEQNYYYLGFTLFRYGENWKISSPASALANINALGAPQKTTVEEFESMINGNNSGSNSSPAWSPDGQRLAFVSSRGGNNEIYVMNADGSSPVTLTNNSTYISSPAWSPDGKRIAFESIRDGNSGIYIVNADGSGLVNLINPSCSGHSPAWSPNGQRIAFACQRSGKSEIYVMNTDGSSPVNLTNNSANSSTPAWSPDGKHIAFESNRDGNYEIYVMKADGSEPARLTNNSAGDSSPAWSPDGKHIAFFSERDGNDEIYVMNADGSEPANLTNNSADDYSPAWSPDGKYIAFVSKRDGNRDGNREIYVMKADGSEPTNLTSK